MVKCILKKKKKNPSHKKKKKIDISMFDSLTTAVVLSKHGYSVISFDSDLI